MPPADPAVLDAADLFLSAAIRPNSVKRSLTTETRRAESIFFLYTYYGLLEFNGLDFFRWCPMYDVHRTSRLLLFWTSIICSKDRFEFPKSFQNSFAQRLKLRGGVDDSHPLPADGRVKRDNNISSETLLRDLSLNSVDGDSKFENAVLENLNHLPLNSSDEMVLLRLQLRVAQVCYS